MERRTILSGLAVSSIVSLGGCVGLLNTEKQIETTAKDESSVVMSVPRNTITTVDFSQVPAGNPSQRDTSHSWRVSVENVDPNDDPHDVKISLNRSDRTLFDGTVRLEAPGDFSETGVGPPMVLFNAYEPGTYDLTVSMAGESVSRTTEVMESELDDGRRSGLSIRYDGDLKIGSVQLQ